MFELKKSRFVFSKIFVIFLFLFSVVCYGQDKRESETGVYKKSQIFAAKPKTIELQPDKIIVSADASDNEKQLFLSEKKGLIYSFDLETAEQMWLTDLGGRISSNLVEAGNLIYVITSKNNPSENNTSENNTSKNNTSKNNTSENKNYIPVKDVVENNSVLWAIDKNSGITSGKIEVGGGTDFYLFKSGELVYVVNDSKVSVFNKNLDKSVEDYSFKEKLVGQPLFDKERGNLYLVFENGVVELNIGKDNLIYKKTGFGEGKILVSAFAFSSDTLFIGDVVGNLYAFDKNDKTGIWKFRAGGKISDIQVFADKIVVSSFDNFIYCLQKTDGKRIWKKRFPGRISKVFKSSDGDFFVRSTYSDDFYLVDAISGDVIERYPGSQKGDSRKLALQTNPRLIMILKRSSIDIYKKN